MIHLLTIEDEEIDSRAALAMNWSAPQLPDNSASQLLRRSDVELHPDEGGAGVEENPHQGVQAGVLSAGSVEKARGEEDVVLRDAIERIVLEFPGYGYRRVRRRFNGRGGRSTISGFCASCVKDHCCANCDAASRRPPLQALLEEAPQPPQQRGALCA
jgi:hypothetical protein